MIPLKDKKKEYDVVLDMCIMGVKSRRESDIIKSRIERYMKQINRYIDSLNTKPEIMVYHTNVIDKLKESTSGKRLMSKGSETNNYIM